MLMRCLQGLMSWTAVPELMWRLQPVFTPEMQL